MCFSISDQKIIVGLVAALIGTEVGGHAQSPILDPEIQLTAEKYDFKPDTVTVKKGDHVRLVITAIDHDHGFKIEAFQINQKLPKGQAVTVEFMADQVGTFSFQCSQFCGLGHKKMKGKLVVK
jgi:heme/copper-type cytochrome/quinol oxidase subunit 2